jgi:peptidyl-prolyl cis-trans isomerase D
MLDSLRGASKSWVAYILIGLLIVSFGIWGIQDFLGAAPPNQVATVGPVTLGPDDFSRQFRLEKNRLERQNEGKRLSKAQVREAKLHESAMRNLIDETALTLQARSIGLTADDSMVMDYFKGQKGVTDLAGNVDVNRLAMVARENDMTPAMMFERVKSDLIRDQMFNTLMTGLSLPNGMVAALNHVRRERRVVEYLLLDPTRAGVIADPDQAALEKFYKENAKQFEKPETRAVTMLHLSVAELAKGETIPEEEIKRIYDARKSVYVIKEKRRFDQIRFKDEAAAKDGADRLARGESFESVATLQGMTAAEIKIGEATEGDPSIPADAFKIPALAASAPLKGPFGWVILRATEVTPGSTKTIDDVREEIREALTRDKAKRRVLDISNEVDDALGSGATLEEAAKKAAPLTLRVIASLTRDLKSGSGEVIDGLPKDEEFAQQIFLTESGRETSMNSDGDGGYYIARIDGVTPAAVPALANNREAALAAWQTDALGKKLKSLADSIVERAKKGESMAKIGDSLGLAPLSAPGIGRGMSNEIFSEALVEQIFTAKLGGQISGQVSKGRSYVVGRVDRIDINSDPSEIQITPIFNERLRQSLASDISSAFIQAARTAKGVTEPDEARWKTLIETN